MAKLMVFGDTCTGVIGRYSRVLSNAPETDFHIRLFLPIGYTSPRDSAFVVQSINDLAGAGFDPSLVMFILRPELWKPNPPDLCMDLYLIDGPLEREGLLAIAKLLPKEKVSINHPHLGLRELVHELGYQTNVALDSLL